MNGIYKLAWFTGSQMPQMLHDNFQTSTPDDDNLENNDSDSSSEYFNDSESEYEHNCLSAMIKVKETKIDNVSIDVSILCCKK